MVGVCCSELAAAVRRGRTNTWKRPKQTKSEFTWGTTASLPHTRWWAVDFSPLISFHPRTDIQSKPPRVGEGHRNARKPARNSKGLLKRALNPNNVFDQTTCSATSSRDQQEHGRVVNVRTYGHFWWKDSQREEARIAQATSISLKKKKNKGRSFFF